MARKDKGPTGPERLASLEQSRLHIQSTLNTHSSQLRDLRVINNDTHTTIINRLTTLEARMRAMKDHPDRS